VEGSLCVHEAARTLEWYPSAPLAPATQYVLWFSWDLPAVSRSAETLGSTLRFTTAAMDMIRIVAEAGEELQCRRWSVHVRFRPNTVRDPRFTTALMHEP